MKNYYLIFVFLFINNLGYGQINCPSELQVYTIDSTSFEIVSNLNFNLQIDTSNPNNIWQIGSVNKLGFDSAYHGTKALQTDTLNNYPTHDSSAFYIWIQDTTFGIDFPGTFSMTWKQKYNLSAQDSCIIQYSIDTGQTWLPIFDWTNFNPWFFNFIGNFNQSNTNQLYFSNTSNNWEAATLCMTFLGLKKPIDNRFGLRFMLKTDSVQESKPGWMIDDLKIFTPSFFSSLNSFKIPKLEIFPNPSNDFIKIYSAEKSIQEIRFYNTLGILQNQLILPKNTYNYQVEISNLANGIYFIDAVLDGIHVRQKFVKE